MYTVMFKPSVLESIQLDIITNRVNGQEGGPLFVTKSHGILVPSPTFSHYCVTQ